MELDGAQTLAWRLHRHSLVPETASVATRDPRATSDCQTAPDSQTSDQSNAQVAEVVDRVVALRAWPEIQAENAIRGRAAGLAAGSLVEAQAAGAVIRSYALRGGSYFFTPVNGADLLSVRTTTKVWESPRFQRQGAFVIDDWEPLREAVREACSEGPRTRAEISSHVLRYPALRGLETGLGGAASDCLYKPLHWWGDICFGPWRDGVATFRWLRDDPAWPGLPEIDVAGPRAISAYVHSYAPVTNANLHYWLSAGLSVPRARVRQWLTALDDELVHVSVRGPSGSDRCSADSVDDAVVLASDLDDIRSTGPEESLQLLPGFDPWLMGPGTADSRIISEHRRSFATRGANLIVYNGVVTGAWKFAGGRIRTQWFDEAGPVPQSLLDEQVRKLERSRDGTPTV